MDASTDRSIVMWGAPASGKSTYLTSLVYFNRSLDDKSRRWCVLPSNAVTAEWVSDRVRTLRGEGDMLRTTTATPKRLDFRLYTLPALKTGILPQTQVASHLATKLVFWDVPGDRFMGEMPDDLLATMLGARGLILLVNPSAEPPEGRSTYYMRFFQQTLGKLTLAMQRARARGEKVALDGENRITFPVAICLSQVDRNPEFWERNPLELFTSLFGDSVPLLTKWLTTWDVLMLSATGRPLTRVGGQEVLEGDPDPRRVLLPISYVLDPHRAGAA
jgi:hypothetical protein